MILAWLGSTFGRVQRRRFLQLSAAGSALAVQPLALSRSVSGASVAQAVSGSAFEWEEATIPELQTAMASGRETAGCLTDKYLHRIREIDRAGPALNAVIETNPEASSIARSLDEERSRGKVRGPLHGIPVLVKDNIDTHDRMMTTAGSLALEGSVPKRDATLVGRLRDAGAVLLGKANLSEWANFRSSRSTSGWSGRGGLTKNPYALDRNPSGSSSGCAVAVAANLCVAAIGTETDGSIMSPATVCGVVGIKPTVGLVSRAGIIPISRTQDTAGPIARTVFDAAIVLGALTGSDPRDSITEQFPGKHRRDYTPGLERDGLDGVRIGVVRSFFDRASLAESVLKAALRALTEAGATLVDPVDIPSMRKLGGAEWEVMLYEFKAGLNAYLAGLGPAAPVKTLAEIVAFNESNRQREMPHFGQETFLQAEAKGSLTNADYLEALAKCRRCSREEGIDAVMDENELDALVAPSGGPAAMTDLVYGDRSVGGSSSPAAVAGYPSITVPAGRVRGLPVGISFFGRADSEPNLLVLAHVFEQSTRARKAPKFLPTVG